MKIFTKRFLASVTALSLVVLAGCSSKPAATTETKPADNKPVEIRFAWWGDTKRNEIYNQIADNFEKANPNIKITREASSWNDYWDKLATQTAGGNAPDVFGMHFNFVSDYARRGAMLSLEDYVKNGVIDTKDMEESVVNSGKIGGVNYMIPQGVTFSNQFINLSLLEKLGVAAPSPNWTWEEYAAKAKEVVDAAKKAGMNDVYGMHDVSNQLQFIRYQFRQDGKDLYDKDGNIAFDEKDVEKWFSYWKNLRDNGLIPDAVTANEHAKDTLEQNLFTKGKIAFSLFAVNQIHLYQQQMGDTNIGIMRNPTSATGKNGEYIEGAHFAISAKTDKAKQDAAAKFINYFVNSEEAQKIFKVEQGVPANKKMAEIVKPLLNPAQGKFITYVNDTLKYAEIAVYPPKGATQVDTAFKDAASKVAYNKATPAQAAKEFVDAAKGIIQSNK